jgi:hypothetical protein
MMNFRKIAAASKGRLVLRYFTEDKPEPIHPPALDEAGRQLEEGGRLVAYYTGRDSRASWRPDMPGLVARAIGIDPHKMPRDAEMSRLFEARRLRPGVLAAQVCQPCRRIRRNAGRKRGDVECRRSRG